MALTKSAFAAALGVSKSTISRYCAQGMAGHLPDGTIDEDAAREWVRTNIRPHVTDAGAGGAIGAGAAVEDFGDDDDVVDDIAYERARLTRLKADMAQIELERMQGGTEAEQNLKLIEAIIMNLWWAFQRNSPHALTGAFLGNGWLDLKDGPSCARASSLILARDCTIMRQLADVIEAAISGNLAPVNGRRDLIVPWQDHQLEWAAEVGEVFQAAIDDRALLVAGDKSTQKEVFSVDVHGEVHTTTKIMVQGANDNHPTLTADRLRALLVYDPDTGVFVWKERPAATRLERTWNARCARKVAGSLHSTGYWHINIGGRLHKAHRLAMLWVTGTLPLADIDHINEFMNDNRAANLRLATRSQNVSNFGAKANNTSGFKGCYWHKATGKWCASVRKDGKAIHLGLFTDPGEAHAAYAAAANDLFGEYARVA